MPSASLAVLSSPRMKIKNTHYHSHKYSMLVKMKIEPKNKIKTFLLINLKSLETQKYS